MIRPLLIITISAVALAQTKPRASEGQLDGSQNLFTVLAAINAAGYDAGLESGGSCWLPAGAGDKMRCLPQVRQQVRESIASKHLESVEALKKFFEAHRQANADAELSQYISFALTPRDHPIFNPACSRKSFRAMSGSWKVSMPLSPVFTARRISRSFGNGPSPLTNK